MTRDPSSSSRGFVHGLRREVSRRACGFEVWGVRFGGGGKGGSVERRKRGVNWGKRNSVFGRKKEKDDDLERRAHEPHQHHLLLGLPTQPTKEPHTPQVRSKEKNLIPIRSKKENLTSLRSKKKNLTPIRAKRKKDDLEGRAHEPHQHHLLAGLPTRSTTCRPGRDPTT